MEKTTLAEQKHEYEIDYNKIDKIKFCIISNFKSQLSRSNLMLFTLDTLAV